MGIGRHGLAIGAKVTDASFHFVACSTRLLFNGAPPKPVFHGPRGAPRVALTFDDGPGDVTPAVLDVLRRHGAKATFFVLGWRVGAREAILRAAARDGHELGNHTWSHRPTGRALPALVALAWTNAAIRRATGIQPRLFRAPRGHLTHGLSRAAGAANLAAVGWDVDPLDWSEPGTDQIVARVLDATQPGSIILLHDGLAPDPDALLMALGWLLPELHDRGYDLVTVPELLDWPVATNGGRP